MPPGSASSTLSVSNCRSTRRRLAPRLSRTAISRRLAAARARSRFAILAQAIARMKATMVIRTKSGFEYCRRSESTPDPPSSSQSAGRSARSLSFAAEAERELMESCRKFGLRVRQRNAGT